MPDLGLAQEASGVKRRRQRVNSLTIDKEKIAQRIQDFYDNDTEERNSGGEVDRRLQRYAKFRQWRSSASDDGFDVAMPDLATHSLRIQDTLHNATMTMRPCISAVPNAVKTDEEKARLIDDLIDYQVFTENQGEKFIGDAADSFVNDSCLTVFIPWVKEERDVLEIKRFDPIPPEALPKDHFTNLMLAQFKGQDVYPSEDGWDWTVIDEEDRKGTVHFYTTDTDEVEMVIERPTVVFEGPRPTVLDWEDILYPARCENLQAPGPSNPLGAAHAIKLDYPQLDEIRRLKESGFYNLLTDEDIDKLVGAPDGTHANAENDEEETQKDKLAGRTKQPVETTSSHKPLTRVVCFDRFDIDGDGLDEDVIWWMLLDTKTMLRACYLTEMYPSDPPRRPFAEASFIPVRGRRDGISLLELLEPSHDYLKQTADQTSESGNIANLPFGFYRAGAQMKPETIKLRAGFLYPLGDPQNDVNFPIMPGQSQAFGINMMTIFSGLQEKLAMQSDLNFGQVPAGQASALRTSGGQRQLISQSEARPERILRRWFMALTEVWAQIHELNQRFLPKHKKFRIMGYRDPARDPYQEITSREAIAGRFQFTFKANVLNTSKQALQNSLQQIAAMYITPLAIESGNVGATELNNFFRDWARAWGVDPDAKGYLATPPELMGPKITAEDAITSIMNYQLPNGRPAEDPVSHLQKLIVFFQSDDFGKLDETSTTMFGQYLQQVEQLVQRALIRQQQLAAAAEQSQQPKGEGGTPAAAPDTSTQMLSPNEQVNEQLPSAKGGE